MRPLAALLNETIRVETDGWPDEPTPAYLEIARRLSVEGPTANEIAYIVGALASALVRLPDSKRTLWRVISDWPAVEAAL